MGTVHKVLPGKVKALGGWIYINGQATQPHGRGLADEACLVLAGPDAYKTISTQSLPI